MRPDATRDWLPSQHFLNLTEFVLHFPGYCFRSAFVLQPATTSQDPRRFFEFALDFSRFALNSVFGAFFHTMPLVVRALLLLAGVTLRPGLPRAMG